MGDVRDLLSDLVVELPRDQLGPTAAAVAQYVMAGIATGQIKIRHAGDASGLMRVLVDIARIESGSPNSINVAAPMTDDEVRDRIEMLQARGRNAQKRP